MTKTNLLLYSDLSHMYIMLKLTIMCSHENALIHADSKVHLVELGNLIKILYHSMNIVWQAYIMIYITKDNFLEISFLQYKNIYNNMINHTLAAVC